MDVRVLFLLAVINLPIYPVLGSLLFGGRTPFLAAARRLHPSSAVDISHWLMGDRESLATDLLLGLFIGACLSLVVVEYRLLDAFFPIG